MAMQAPNDTSSRARPESLRVDDLRKRFGPTLALKGVSFACEPGTVHGLIGENGAGKSTLVKILSGVLRPDSGRVLLFGQEAVLNSPQQSLQSGIATAFQELPLVPYQSIAHNLLLRHEPAGRAGYISESAVNREAQHQLESIGITDLPVDRMVNTLTLAAKQKVEIARALLRQPKVLLLDEPTSALGASDVDWLFSTMQRLTQAGVTVVIVSHRLAEIRQVCTRMTVLRDGLVVGTFEADAVSNAEIIQHMIGRSLAGAFSEKTTTAPSSSAPLLRAEGISGPHFHNISLEVRPGEIVGIGGLQGQGHRELFLALFGDQPIHRGRIVIGDKARHLRSPRDAIRAGVGLIPEERKTEGLFLELTGRENVALPSVRRLSRLGFVRRKEERDRVLHLLDRIDVTSSALYRPAKAFSGGNQQKMLFAKWLLPNSRVLLLYDPTRGVDVGAKHAIYTMMRELADGGAALLFYSTELEELLHLPDRVYAMYGGRLSAPLSGEKLNHEQLLAAIMGLEGQAEKGADAK